LSYDGRPSGSCDLFWRFFGGSWLEELATRSCETAISKGSPYFDALAHLSLPAQPFDERVYLCFQEAQDPMPSSAGTAILARMAFRAAFAGHCCCAVSWLADAVHIEASGSRLKTKMQVGEAGSRQSCFLHDKQYTNLPTRRRLTVIPPAGSADLHHLQASGINAKRLYVSMLAQKSTRFGA